MKEFNFHVKPIGLLDMLHFKTLVPNRQKKLSQGSLEPVTSVFNVNKLASFLHPESQRATITKVIEHGDIAKTYILSGSGLAPFRAGQYVSVRLNISGSVLTRPYSISSSPGWAGEGKYAITVKRTADGFASDWILENWHVGTKVSMSGPEGTFYYEPLRDARHVVGVAGGSGITPFLSMAYAIRDGIEDFELTVLYGSRCEADILFREELEAIAAACGKVKIANVLSEEQSERFDCGFITAELINKYGKDKPYSLFLCGPAAMYAFLDKELDKLSLECKYIRRELMAAPSSPAGIAGYPGYAEKVYSLTVNMCGETRTVPMKACETVLTAIERAGINAPSRCRSGECGWCRSLLNKGEAFTPAQFDGRRMADVKTGHIHPCCAYPLSDLTIEIWPEQEG